MRLPRFRFTVRRMMGLVAIVAVLMAVATAFRRHGIGIVETLEAPVEVAGWSDDGLHLADGRIVGLPGVQTMPTSSAGLRQAIRQGVEIDIGARTPPGAGRTSNKRPAPWLGRSSARVESGIGFA